VAFVRIRVHRFAGLASPDLRRRFSSPIAALRRPCPPGGHRCARHSLAVVLVPAPSRLEHPCSFSPSRRRAAALRRRICPVAGRSPAAGHLQETVAAGSLINGPD
jgi:hypothetical protein